MAKGFFDEQAEQSQVKTAIVSKYFFAWAKVISGAAKRSANPRIAYIDLFAGPGRYQDGTKSTPLFILEKAIQDADLRDMLVTLFNDKEYANAGSLREAINAMPGIETLTFAPEVNTEEVGEQMVQLFEKTNLVPTLFFADPWGYKGLSLGLINSVLRNWGCECIFFFNYSRVNAGLSNPTVKEHMDALFGVDRAESLRARLAPMNAAERELAIVEEICQALIEMGGKYTLPFGFHTKNTKRLADQASFDLRQ